VLAALVSAVMGGSACRCRGPGSRGRWPSPESFLANLAGDLLAHRGAGLVLVGRARAVGTRPGRGAQRRARQRGQRVTYHELADRTVRAPGGNRRTVSRIAAGSVKTWSSWGNPVYDAPADLRFAELLVGCRTRCTSASTTTRPRAPAAGTCRRPTRSRPGATAAPGTAPDPAAAADRAAVRRRSPIEVVAALLDPVPAGGWRSSVTRCVRPSGRGLRAALAALPARRAGRGTAAPAAAPQLDLEAVSGSRSLTSRRRLRVRVRSSWCWCPTPRSTTAVLPTTAGSRSCRTPSPRSPGATRCCCRRPPP